jgi:hypothetical protein
LCSSFACHTDTKSRLIEVNIAFLIKDVSKKDKQFFALFNEMHFEKCQIENCQVEKCVSVDEIDMSLKLIRLDA